MDIDQGVWDEDDGIGEELANMTGTYLRVYGGCPSLPILICEIDAY